MPKKYGASLAHSSGLTQNSKNHDMKLLSLPNNSFKLLNAKLNKQFMKCTYLNRLMLTPQRQETEQALRTTCFTSVSLNKGHRVP
jgi:hypothetical protein